MSKRPSNAELDEGVKVDLDPEEFIEVIVQTGPHPDEKPKSKPDKGE